MWLCGYCSLVVLMATQDVVILGSGAFACEAMEAAVANNAASVTLVTRERRRCGRGARALPGVAGMSHEAPCRATCPNQI